jgi:hypothetical protein
METLPIFRRRADERIVADEERVLWRAVLVELRWRDLLHAA